MGCLLERKAQIIFVSASSVDENGKKRRVVIESRPEFADCKTQRIEEAIIRSPGK